MNTRRFVLAGFVASTSAGALLGACATDDTAAPIAAEASTIPVTNADGATGDAEADVSAEAAPDACVDCEYFPTTCSGDILCQNGPFDRNNPGGSLDGRTRINVLRGRSANDIWAVGALGGVAHFDGTSWTASDLGSQRTLQALWLRDGGEVTLGAFDQLYTRGLAYDAGPDAEGPSDGGWATRPGPSTPPDYMAILLRFASGWAAPDGQYLWCATIALGPGFTSGVWRMRAADAGEFELVDAVPPSFCVDAPCSQMLAVHGASPTDVWSVGMMGSTIHITDAESETPVIKAFDSQTLNALRGVWAASPIDAWAVGAGGTIRHYKGDASRWDIVDDVPTTANLNAVWGSSSSDVWAVGDDAVVLHYDGTRWSRVKIAGLEARRPELTAVWMSAPGHVWIGGQGVVLSVGGKP